MPWVVKKNKDKFCVYKKGDDTPMKGACHNSRADAIRQMRALYANSKEFSQAIAGTVSMMQALKFSESEVEDGKLRKWIQAFPYGSWDHPMYGMSYFAKWNAENMAMNFHDKVHGTELLATDYEHGLDPAKGNKASGTILDMEPREDGMWWFVEFTPQATKEIQDGEWTYFSPEYHDAWENPMDQTIYADVARGGALTIKPWIKGMMPLNFSELLVEKGVLNLNEQTGEVAWEEHHDPDQDPHQQPKPDDDRSGGGDSGSRIDTPPPEGGVVDNEQEASVEVTAAMLTALGLPEDATQEDIEKAITDMSSEIAPLREASEAEKAFSEKYPEQAKLLSEQKAEIDRLRGKDAERDAEAFGKRFSEFVVKVRNEGDDDDDGDDGAVTEVRKGFSAVVCDQLTELHKKFSDGSATADDLTPILESIVKGDGIVEYGERGTSTDSTTEDDAANPQEAARRLSQLAEAKIAEAGGDAKMTFGDALAQVVKENPELAKVYNDRSAGKEG
jgi:Mu-like prophage I protein